MRICRHLFFLTILIMSTFVMLACGQEVQPTVSAPATPQIITLTDNSPLPLPRDVSVLPTPIPFQFPEDLSAVTIEPGKVVVIGRLISSITGQPIANTPVRMAQIYYAEEGNRDPEQGAWALNNAFSPFAYSNENGYFIFENVDPMDFVVFVGDILDRYNTETNENERPIPHTALADELTDLGDIRVEY
jgi:hypothetical protein